jgi:hypothetical protein
LFALTSFGTPLCGANRGRPSHRWRYTPHLVKALVCGNAVKGLHGCLRLHTLRLRSSTGLRKALAYPPEKACHDKQQTKERREATFTHIFSSYFSRAIPRDDAPGKM